MKQKRTNKKATDTLHRRLDMLMAFTRNNQVLTTQEITLILNQNGDFIDESLVLRTLKQLEQAKLLEVVEADDNQDNDDYIDKKTLTYTGKWRWPVGLDSRLKVLPKFTIGEVIAFRLVELILKPLLPRESYEAIRPYLTVAQKQCDIQPKWQRINQWEKKVRVIPPAQPLLPPESPFQEKVRAVILEALFRDRQCRITYQQIWRDEPAEWIIHPLCYLQRGPAFYLLCMIEDFTDVRQLALHRMRSAKVLDSEVRKPEDFNDRDYLDREVERNQGMGGSSEPIRLVARFWKRAGLHLQETRLSADQVITNDEASDGHFRITATVNDTAQLRWWLLSFGSNVEVIEPVELRTEIAHNAYWMHQMYSQSQNAEAGD
ncbi:MAG: transcriptional regulator [Pseudomonadota bacterium]|nr:transcriptional regulator [Pseudomonadota bacterium]